MILLLWIRRYILLSKRLVHILTCNNVCRVCRQIGRYFLINYRLPIIEFLIHNRIEEPYHFKQSYCLNLKNKDKKLILLTVVYFDIVIVVIFVPLYYLVLLTHNIKEVTFALFYIPYRVVIVLVHVESRQFYILDYRWYHLFGHL